MMLKTNNLFDKEISNSYLKLNIIATTENRNQKSETKAFLAVSMSIL